MVDVKKTSSASRSCVFISGLAWSRERQHCGIMEDLLVFFERVIDFFRDPPPSLLRMDLGVCQKGQNPLMVSPPIRWTALALRDLTFLVPQRSSSSSGTAKAPR